MNIIRKNNIYPIIIPNIYFKDIYNQHNSFFEMNPSLHIDTNGNAIILIRNIDYRIFGDNKFTIYNHPTNSIYMVMNGVIKRNEKLDIDNFTLDKIDYNYNLPTYPTYWKGMEDIRFIDDKNILVTIPECNTGGNPCIFKAIITNNVIHTFKMCNPNTIEKNWMPFIYSDGNYKVIYSLNPFIIKSIEEEVYDKWELCDYTLDELKGYHGSTNGISYMGFIWFLIHVKKDRIYHKWIKLDLLNKQIHVSKEFVFFKYSHVEFPTNICLYDDRIFISLGVNDIKAFIVEITLDELNVNF